MAATKPEAIGSLETLAALQGGTERTSGWSMIDQPMVDAFAELTGDRQWIHVDPARAAASPFGGTIAHGMLTLSLVPGMFGTVFVFPNRRMSLNYGFQKVRFITPVRTGSRVRAGFVLTSYDALGAADARVEFNVSLGIEGEERPGLVAAWLLQMGY